MRLVKLTEGKELSADETAIAAMLRYTLDNGHHPPAECNGFDKVSLTMISRVVSMVRSHIIRSERIQILSELQSRIEPSAELSINPAEPKKKNMKPALVFAITAAIAVGISAFTAVIISGAARASADQQVPVEDSLSNGTVELIEMETRQHTSIAFAINQSGIIVTIADAVAGKREIELMEISGNQGVMADVVYLDKARNIAILTARNPELGSVPYRFSPDEVKVGEALYSLAVQDSTLLYAESYLSSKSSTGHGRIKLDLSTSGSPLLTPHGQIAGMVSHADDGPNGVAYLITADQIKESIDRWATRDVIHVALPNRNQLFYENRANQIEKISQFLYKIEYETEVPVTIP
jgi:hypothetical protein